MMHFRMTAETESVRLPFICGNIELSSHTAILTLFSIPATGSWPSKATAARGSLRN